MGTYNHHPFKPVRELPALQVSNNELAYPHQGVLKNYGIYSSLDHATRKYGCYMLRLDELSFTHLAQPWTKPAVPGTRPDRTRVVMRLDAREEGSITLRHTNIPDAQGRWTTWMWIYIVKPLVDVHGRAPPELCPMPDSWMLFGVPSLKVNKVAEK